MGRALRSLVELFSLPAEPNASAADVKKRIDRIVALDRKLHEQLPLEPDLEPATVFELEP